MEINRFIREKCQGSRSVAANEIGVPRRTIDNWCYKSQEENHTYDVIKITGRYEVLLTKRVR